MKVKKTAAPRQLPSKLATGIQGFDELSHGGLTPNRTTLLLGGPGSGKTVFALQTLVNAARRRDEPGIFVAFEETTRRIIANAACFNWGLPALARNKLFFLEAQLSPEVVQSGEFDLSGMLAMLKAKKQEIGARWVVFDGIDVLLTLLQNPIAEMREIYRIRDWLADNEMNAIVTAKIEGGSSEAVNYGFMQFMMDCVIRLGRRLEHGVSLHRLEITKYRGSDFVAGEYPVSFGPSGMEVGAPEPAEISHAASTERISAGFERLDTMLGGGLFRGSSTLITGVPGTSKTTLTGKFAEAACRRGERTLFVSFDEGAEPIMRNLASVGIQLKPHVQSGLLRMYSARTESIGAEEHLIKLKALIREHRPRCMVIDPLSAIAKAGGLAAARAVANRLIYMAKDEKVTVMITAISEGDDPQTEATELQISTVADTWIHLSYVVRSGERNRALTIIKSRGTWHSNQVRELILSETGPMLADVYTAGGEVLMGTLRWEKETEEKARKTQRRADADHKQRELQFTEADTRARIKALELDLHRQRAELASYSRDNEARMLSSSEKENELRKLRSADPAGRAALTPADAKVRGANGSGNSGNGKKARKEARDAP
ncbi:circadian clock protein KaiC [Sulfuricaulis limicola]|uniref:Circadian clock protein KaiC n=1 Tax=Sulfuricaulis limicola TaxID=1620215 RepID=A0A1B4XH58_9GAMM|nr:circadian clock protein KaiC [Sulfuricaulis limicola]BAV34128.1 circadian clock protein KaiC [Sulfuricaulis limicola]